MLSSRYLAVGQKSSNFFLGFGCGRISMGFGCDLGLRFERPHFKFSCECFTFHNSMYSSRSSKSREARRSEIDLSESVPPPARSEGPGPGPQKIKFSRFEPLPPVTTRVTRCLARRRRKFVGGRTLKITFYHRFLLLEHLPGHLGGSILGLWI